jgi:hypothetical protein
MDETTIEAEVDSLLTRFQTASPIKYYPYVEGELDLYKQRTKSFGPAVTLVGRAIHKPTPEQLTVIGNGESYEMAFLFSRTELKRKFPTADEGQWLLTSGQLEWRTRRYSIEKVAPTGQVSTHFILVVALAESILGSRDP